MGDFYERKKYLAKVEREGEQTVEWLCKMQDDVQEKKMKESELKVKEQINDICSGLHHLISTNQIPGIYNSPYCDVVPTAFGVPIEESLKTSQKLDHPHTLRRPSRKLRAKPTKRTQNTNIAGFTDNAETADIPPHPLGVREPLLSRTANVGRMMANQGPFKEKEQLAMLNAHAHNLHRSIQSMNPYDIVKERNNQETRLNKLTRVAPDDFVCKRPIEGAFIPSVHADTVYKGPSLSEFRDDYWELPKIKDKPPFFTATKRDLAFNEYDMLGPQI